MTDRRYILFDIDDTCFSTKHREHLIDVSWDAFHSEAHKDEPIYDIFRTLEFLSNSCDPKKSGYDLVAVTARPERYRAATLQKLIENGITPTDILMRPEDNYDPAPQLKVYLAQCYFEGDFSEVKFVIDDHPGVIAAFRELGVTGLLVHSVHGRRDFK
jgi:FMN phosphatase YigB (HAD superfamily)